MAVRFVPDRKSKHPNQHLATFAGTLPHTDDFAGFDNLYRTSRIHEAACWTHVRCKFHDIWQADYSPKAKLALDRLGALALYTPLRTKFGANPPRSNAGHAWPGPAPCSMS